MMKQNDSNQEKEIVLKRIKDIECQTEVEKDRLKKISSAQEYLVNLKENIDKCSDVLSRSLEVGHEREKFHNLINEGDKNYSKAKDSFEEYSFSIREKIDKFNDERDILIAEYESNRRNNQDRENN